MSPQSFSCSSNGAGFAGPCGNWGGAASRGASEHPLGGHAQCAPARCWSPTFTIPAPLRLSAARLPGRDLVFCFCAFSPPAGILLVSRDDHIQAEGQTDARRAVPGETDPARTRPSGLHPGNHSERGRPKKRSRLEGDGGRRETVGRRPGVRHSSHLRGDGELKQNS